MESLLNSKTLQNVYYYMACLQLKCGISSWRNKKQNNLYLMLTLRIKKKR